MNIQQQINQHIESLPEPKQTEMLALHRLVLKIIPEGRLWFDTGINEENKVVSNPTIGYGLQTIRYANGKSKEFFRIGLSANTSGISVYILGISDKQFLANTYGNRLGKAKVTGYCIKFKTLNDINTDVLEEAIRFGIEIA